jgi:hypothetical protein
MPYTLSLNGVVVGETDFEHKGRGPGQQAGIFRPTPLGLDVLPRVTGMFAASLAFTRVVGQRKSEIESAEGIVSLMENTPEGRQLIEHAKVIDQLELRDPDGHLLAVESIAVSNLQELAELAASKLGKAVARNAPPRYLISATIRSCSRSDSGQNFPAIGHARFASSFLQ